MEYKFYYSCYLSLITPYWLAWVKGIDMFHEYTTALDIFRVTIPN